MIGICARTEQQSYTTPIHADGSMLQFDMTNCQALFSPNYQLIKVASMKSVPSSSMTSSPTVTEIFAFSAY